MGRRGRFAKDLTKLPAGIFGRLTPLRQLGISADDSAIWECRCSCGKLIHISYKSLCNSKRPSCGCLQRELKDQKERALEERLDRIELLLSQGNSLSEVGQQLGVSPQRISQLLQKRDKKIADIRKSLQGCPHRWTEEERVLLGTKSDRSLSVQFGILPCTIRKERKRLGIPRYQKPPPISVGYKCFRLTAKERIMKTKPGGARRAYWRCDCSCGNQCLVDEGNLSRRLQKSCGCWARDRMSKVGKSNKGRKRSRMTSQEYYDLLVKSAGDGTFPSFDKEEQRCFYRTGAGKRCAIGILIPEDKYRASFDYFGKDCGATTRWVLENGAFQIPDGLSLADLYQIQMTHDRFAWEETWDASKFVQRINELPCFSNVKKEEGSWV